METEFNQRYCLKNACSKLTKYVCIFIVFQCFSTLFAFSNTNIDHSPANLFNLVAETLQDETVNNKTQTEEGVNEDHSNLIIAISISVLLNVSCIVLFIFTKKKQLKFAKIIKQQEKEIDYLNLFKINNAEERKVSSNKDLSKFGQLDKLMRLDKFYLNPSCNRETLLAELDIDKNAFSELLKKYGFDNLPDYINRFRLEEAIKLLNNEGENLSIDQIAKQAGFGTSRSLQRQFKDKYNISPNEYRKCFSKNKKIVDAELL